MPATPASIARYTRDGVTVTYDDETLKANVPTAIDSGEVPTFFRYKEDALALMTERANLTAKVGDFHEAIEVDEVLGIGTAVPVWPATPCFQVIDDTREVDLVARTRSVSFDTTVDRYSVELVG